MLLVAPKTGAGKVMAFPANGPYCPLGRPRRQLVRSTGVAGLLERLAEREPDGSADGVEISRGEGERSDAGRILDRLAAVEEIEDLKGDAHAVRPGLIMSCRQAA